MVLYLFMTVFWTLSNNFVPLFFELTIPSCDKCPYQRLHSWYIINKYDHIINISTFIILPFPAMISLLAKGEARAFAIPHYIDVLKNLRQEVFWPNISFITSVCLQNKLKFKNQNRKNMQLDRKTLWKTIFFSSTKLRRAKLTSFSCCIHHFFLKNEHPFIL